MTLQRLKQEKPWAKLRMTRRQYEKLRPWAGTKLSRERWEELLSFFPDETIKAISDEVDADRLVNAIFRGSYGK